MTATMQRTTEMNKDAREIKKDRKKPISEAVITAVAAAEGVDPSELSTRLYDSIDPDALDDLYATACERDSHLRLTFTLCEHEVVIEKEKQIVVRAHSEDANH